MVFWTFSDDINYSFRGSKVFFFLFPNLFSPTFFQNWLIFLAKKRRDTDEKISDLLNDLAGRYIISKKKKHENENASNKERKSTKGWPKRSYFLSSCAFVTQFSSSLIILGTILSNLADFRIFLIIASWRLKYSKPKQVS